ncbi:MAG: chemotaxis protein CheD [Deltaproteobacteria bacterium]|nr:chemotaxis protein CheD [Deltaproteobacteria bacterium]
MRRYSTHLPTRELRPGELLVVEQPSVAVTVLGSCVAVTLFHRRTRLGALCHAMLPEAAARGTGDDPFRYVEPSLRYMAAEFRRRGIGARETEVKMFGGGDVLLSRPRDGDPTVGARNVSAALQCLDEQEYTIMARDVGGTRGRKIYFDTSSGFVFVKRLSRVAPEPRWGGRPEGA